MCVHVCTTCFWSFTCPPPRVWWVIYSCSKCAARSGPNCLTLSAPCTLEVQWSWLKMVNGVCVCAVPPLVLRKRGLPLLIGQVRHLCAKCSGPDVVLHLVCGELYSCNHCAAPVQPESQSVGALPSGVEVNLVDLNAETSRLGRTGSRDRSWMRQIAPQG